MSLVLNFAASVVCGYLAVVFSYLVLTLVVTAMMPKLVMQKGLFTRTYLLMHPVLWIVCGFAGGYVAAALPTASPYVAPGILALLVGYIVLTNAGQLNRAKTLEAGMVVAGISGGAILCLSL